MVLSDKVRERTATGVLSVSASNTPRDNISTHDISDMGGQILCGRQKDCVTDHDVTLAVR